MSGEPASRLPQAIGRYRILKELGRGMMGVVYLAQDPALERLVALKTIDLAFAVPENERASFERRFLAEARVAARLQHPGIVVVHDVGRDEGRGILYIALEYLHGRTLAGMAAPGRPLPWREALRIVAALARALHHAHAQGIVHRDVKPANVMLLPSGLPKIMDFGIAKVPNLELTSAGQFFGTPLYMSPEQASGGALDGRSDLFSLGAVAYLLLTGRQAFQAENVLQVLSRVAKEDPPPPSTVAPEVPVEVDHIVARAMAKDPERRYPSGEDLASDIDAVLAGRPAPAGEELPVLELEDEPLAAVLGEPAPAAPAPTAGRRAERPSAALPPPSPASRRATLAEPPPAPAAARRRGRGSWARHPAVVAAAALLVIAVGWAVLRPRRPATRPREAPAAESRARETDAPRVVEPAPPSDENGRLEVDFEHHLHGGRIEVWVDDDLVLDEQFDSRVARKILSVRLRKGEVQEVLAVPPGRHEVRVRLQWSGRAKSRRITGTFAAGETRTLRVRVSRVFNELSLGWSR